MLEEKIAEVERIFQKLDDEIGRLQSWSGLHCKFGCGKCCFKPDIEATILEFIPFAYQLHKENKLEEWLEKLTTTNESVCLILNPTQQGTGLCSAYPHRGLICRLFGYSARTNKYGKRELITCQLIKTEQSESFEKTQLEIESGEKEVPVMSQYYMQLHAIDFELTRDFYPINTAIKKAIETVMHYYTYR